MLTRENINDIRVDWFADVLYQDDGEVNFILESAYVLYDMFFSCSGTDSEKMLLPDGDDWIDAYITSETIGDVTLFKKIEFVYCSLDDNHEPFLYELSDEEALLLTDRVREEVKAKWGTMTLDDILKEAKGGV